MLAELEGISALHDNVEKHLKVGKVMKGDDKCR